MRFTLREGGDHHPTELHSGRPSRGLEPRRGARKRGPSSQLTAPPRHSVRSRQLSSNPSPPYPASEERHKGSRNRSGGGRFLVRQQEVTSPLPVRRIMNDGGWGTAQTHCLLIIFFPLNFHLRVFSGGEGSSGRGFQKSPRDPGSGGAGRRGGPGRPHTLSRPPCLAAPLRPGKEGARAAGPRHPEDRAGPRRSAGWAWGRRWARGGLAALGSLSQPRVSLPREGFALFR